MTRQWFVLYFSALMHIMMEHDSTQVLRFRCKIWHFSTWCLSCTLRIFCRSSFRHVCVVHGVTTVASSIFPTMPSTALSKFIHWCTVFMDLCAHGVYAVVYFSTLSPHLAVITTKSQNSHRIVLHHYGHQAKKVEDVTPSRHWLALTSGACTKWAANTWC